MTGSAARRRFVSARNGPAGWRPRLGGWTASRSIPGRRSRARRSSSVSSSPGRSAGSTSSSPHGSFVPSGAFGATGVGGSQCVGPPFVPPSVRASRRQRGRRVGPERGGSLRLRPRRTWPAAQTGPASPTPPSPAHAAADHPSSSRRRPRPPTSSDAGPASGTRTSTTSTVIASPTSTATERGPTHPSPRASEGGPPATGWSAWAPRRRGHARAGGDLRRRGPRCSRR
jgi:hypothetical protein